MKTGTRNLPLYSASLLSAIFIVLGSFPGWAISPPPSAKETNQEPPEDPGKEHTFTFFGGTYTRDQLMEDYNRVVGQYGIDPRIRQVKTIKELGGVVIKGTVVQTSGTRVILESKGGDHLVMISKRRGLAPGSTNQFIGVQRNVGYVWRNPEHQRISLPQFTDVTLSPQEFVSHLRKEYAFKNLRHIDNIRKETSLLKKPGNEGSRLPSGFNQGAPGSLEARHYSNLRRGKPGELDARDNSNFKREKSADKP